MSIQYTDFALISTTLVAAQAGTLIFTLNTVSQLFAPALEIATYSYIFNNTFSDCTLSSHTLYKSTADVTFQISYNKIRDVEAGRLFEFTVAGERSTNP